MITLSDHNLYSKPKFTMDYYTCPQCPKSFTISSNLSRHLREQHIDGEENCFQNIKAQCELCGKTFKRKEYLKVHMDGKHSAGMKIQCTVCDYSTFHIYALKRHIQTQHNNDKTKNLYLCPICAAQFKFKKHLDYHLKNHYSPESRADRVIEKKCPICPFTATNKNLTDQMYSHFDEVHNTPIEIDEIKFASISEFDRWKSRIEIETTSRFIKFYRQKLKTTRYQCHRSGTFNTTSTGKRSPKIIGSVKINGFCPASITSKIKDSGEVLVKFVKTHVGHKPDLQHIPLTMEEKTFIADKLARKIPHKEILRDIKSSATNSQLKRIHLITKKDLFNIEKTFNLSREVINNYQNDIASDYNDDSQQSIHSELSETEENTDSEFLIAKEAFITDLESTLRNKITNIDQLNAMKDYCKAIKPMLESEQQSQSTVIPAVNKSGEENGIVLHLLPSGNLPAGKIIFVHK